MCISLVIFHCLFSLFSSFSSLLQYTFSMYRLLFFNFYTSPFSFPFNNYLSPSPSFLSLIHRFCSACWSPFIQNLTFKGTWWKLNPLRELVLYFLFSALCCELSLLPFNCVCLALPLEFSNKSESACFVSLYLTAMKYYTYRLTAYGSVMHVRPLTILILTCPLMAW